MDVIPLVDLHAQYDSIRHKINEAIALTLEQSAFIMGERVAAFEHAFAEYCGVAHAVAASSGTTALHLALMASGVGAGDEVITVSHTFIATAEAICHCSATPVFVDIDPVTYTLDPSQIEPVITPRTKAIIPVHIYGQCADMDAILAIARRHELKVIEDAAQSHGAEDHERRAGSMGDFGCFSFYPGKNLGACGDAGMITTDDGAAAKLMAKLANHGRETKYTHDFVGYNYRMDALQAAILLAKLKHLEDWTAARIHLALRYEEHLRDLPLAFQARRGRHNYHLFVIQCEERDALAAALKSAGIATGIHYPVPLHRQPCFRQMSAQSLPVTEALAARILSLPLYPEMTDEQQDRVIAEIRRFYGM